MYAHCRVNVQPAVAAAGKNMTSTRNNGLDGIVMNISLVNTLFLWFDFEQLPSTFDGNVVYKKIKRKKKSSVKSM